MSTDSAPAALIRRLGEMSDRFAALDALMNDGEVLSNPQKLIAITRERAQLEGVVEKFRQYQKVTKEHADLQAMLSDPDMREMAEAEIAGVAASAGTLLEQLKDEFVAAEDEASKVDSFFLEIRAGTGGEEAALFARDLFEMYRKYAERHGLRFDVNDFSNSDRGGFKEVIVNIKGAGVYRRLRYEGGGHRVQRVPETETQGRIHTSAATVAVLPEMPDVKVDINPRDVEEFGCRGGGPGGQNVNKVETGWFIRHKPSGLSFKMTEHKSQTQNKERAWALLRATLYETEREKQHSAQMGARKAMMGSGDRSARVRTYNFPQNRCTDHRLGGEGGGEKNFNLDAVLQGDLDPLTEALLELDKQHRLESL